MWRICSMLVLVALVTSSFTFALGQSTNPVKILSSSSYMDDIDYLHVVGEIENGSPSVISFVQVIGTFYDAKNQVVGTSFTFTTPINIGPGGRARFDLSLGDASVPIRQIVNYSIQVSYQ